MRSGLNRSRGRVRPPAVCAEPLESRTLLAASLPSGFQEAIWTRGFDTPTAQAFAPDGRLFVLEKAGKVRVVTAAGTALSTPFLTIATETTQDRGLVSLAFDPAFQQNRHVYVYYTKADAAGTRNRLSRFTASSTNPNVAAAGSELVLLEVPMNTFIHTGGAMAFGADGMLYLGVGDGGESSTAQNLSDLRGKVLRLNVSNPSALAPADNPWAGVAGVRPEIFAFGFRNPFSGAMKPGTNTFYVNDVGQEAFEEVNHVHGGFNYGWPLSEGATSDPRFVNPLYAYPHGAAANSAVTGGAFYTAAQFPSNFANDYFLADYVNGWIRRLDASEGYTPKDFASGAAGPLDLDVGPDGALYYLSAFGNGFSGTDRPVYRVSYVGTANRAPTAVASASPTSGSTPLTVDFTGAGSSDPDGDALTYTWNFGNGSSATGRDVAHTYAAAGTYTATLTVADGRGGSSTAAPITIFAGNRAPTATVAAPVASSLYVGGQTISFSGSATDPEDGTLPATAFSWKVLLVHNTHTHDFTTVTGARTGSFVVPTTGHVDNNQAFRIELTVTDSGGVKHVATREIRPQVANLSLATSPAGLQLALDGQPTNTPVSAPSLVGATRALSAPPRQSLAGVEYEIVAWSDGGAATHDVTVPAAGATYTASYRAVPSTQTPFGAVPAIPGKIEAEHFDSGGEGVAYHDVTAANEGGQFRDTAVDLEVAADTGGGFNVGYLKAGEWLEYTADVDGAGTYRLDLRVASLGAGGTLHLEVGGADKTGPINVPDTGGWQAWQTISKSGVALTAGRHVLRLAVDTEGAAGYAGNLNHFTLTRTDGPATPHALPAVADAYIQDGSLASTNYGSRTSLIVKTAGSGLNRHALLKFDLAGLGGAVGSATLRLFGRIENGNATNVPADVYGTAADWQEGTVTWNSQPALASPKLASRTITDNVARWYGWDVTAFVRAELAAGRDAVSLVLKNAFRTSPYTLFNSGEAATNQPQLQITASAAPALPTVSVSAADASASEPGTNTGRFTFTRSGSTAQPLVVTFAAGGTATGGVDYDALGTMITIPAGAASASLTLTARNDSLAEGSETVTVALAAASAYAVSPTSGSATVTIADDDAPATQRRFAPAGDAYVQASAATSNFGSASTLLVKHSSSGTLERVALLKFDLAGLAGTTTAAKLRVFGRVQDTRATNVVVNAFGTTSVWQEGVVNWANRPAATTARLSSATVVDTAGRWYEFDVTPFVRAELAAGRTTVSLLLSSLVATDPYLILNSRENAASRPELLVTTESGPATPAQSPFGGVPVTVPGLVQAENFDDGGEGIAYHDTDSLNTGGAHRTGGVDVEATADAGGGFNVGALKVGEWLEYTVDVAAAGTYTLDVRVASDHPGGSFHVEFGGVDKTGPMRLNFTGGWQTWQTATKTGVALAAGRHVMRVSIDSSDNGGDVGNINWLRLTAETAPQPINWSARAAAPLARDEAQGAAVNGKVYVFGGFHTSDFLASSRVDVYDPATNTWSTRRAMPEALTHAGTVVDGSTVWIVGGYVGNNPGPGTNHVWRYESVADTWTRGPDLPAARGGGAAALLGRKLHFFGGRDVTRTSDRGEHWVLDLDAVSAGWVSRAAMPSPRNHLGAAALNGRVYAIGGQFDETHMAVNSALVHAYDPATNTWTRVADLPAPRSHFPASTFVRNGQIVVAGGESAHNVPAAEVWSYDPGANRWSALSPLPAPRRASVAVLVGATIIVTGGYDGSNHHATTWAGT